MILTLAVIAGILAGGIRAWYSGNQFTTPTINFFWLVPIAFLPQALAFYIPATRSQMSNEWVAIALVTSQILLFVFVCANWRQPAFWLLGLGLFMNLAVIVVNGGLMPISPETVSRLVPNALPDAWQIGERFGFSKDIILPVADTRLWWLSDRFLSPQQFSYKVAFSLGDVLIALGAFVLLWESGGKQHVEPEEG